MATLKVVEKFSRKFSVNIGIEGEPINPEKNSPANT